MAVTKIGPKKYLISVRTNRKLANGEYARKKETFYGSKSDARLREAQMVASIQAGTYINQSTITLGEYLEQWLENVVRPNMAGTTADGYEFKCNAILRHQISNILMQKVNSADVQGFLNDEKERGMGPRSQMHLKAVLRNVFNRAMENIPPLISSNPVTKKIEVDKYSKPKPTLQGRLDGVWQPDTVRRFLSVGSMPVSGWYRSSTLEKETVFYNAIVLILFTGLRRGEMAGLKWSNIDLERGRLLVANARYSTKARGTYEKEPKSDAGYRLITLTTGAVHLLKEIKEIQNLKRMEAPGLYPADGYVVCQPSGKPVRPDGLDAAFKRLIKKYDLPDTTLHQLRHCHGSMLNEIGENTKKIQERMGHSSFKLTMDLYVHNREGDDSLVLDDLDKFFLDKAIEQSGLDD